jgi:N-acetylmuramic acid 6-phosphate etherase
MHDFLDPRLTERRNPRTADIDLASAHDIVGLLNDEDRRVPEVVAAARPALARVIELAVDAFRRGGRLIYIGAGTSGRLGVLDAAECPPTFGTPPSMVVGIIAGGEAALRRSQEGAEDDGAQAERDLAAHEVGADDLVVGIAASGTTPYVGAALRFAHALGAETALVTCADPPPELRDTVREVIALPVGPEALTGSTRMKAGTATKLALNTITTGAMVLLGKAYGNLMVDLQVMSEKLRDRGERIVMEACGVSRADARRTIEAAEGSVKLAVVMARTGTDAAEARRRLEDANGSVREAAGPPPPPVA